MACKINIHNIEALPPIYPKGFQRQVDITKAFRAWTAFAAVRAVMPISGYGRRDFYNFLSKDSIPPYSEKRHNGEIDIHRVMSALFTSDGGVSEVLEYGAENSMTIGEIRRGKTVFDCVNDAEEREIKRPYTKENAAMNGEVHCCFASKYAYRYWWQVFNRAVWALLNNDVKANGVYIDSEFNSATGSFDNEVYINILPYTFSIPDGVTWGNPSYSLESLQVNWTPTLEDARNLIKVEGYEKSFFPEAVNVNTDGVFTIEEYSSHDVRTNEGVDRYWVNFAKGAGFTNYSPGYSAEGKIKRDKIDFLAFLKSRIGNDRPLMFDEYSLRSLRTWAWEGDAARWDTSFPFDALLAMYYFLGLFILLKAKYAIVFDNPKNDPLIGLYEIPQYKQKYRVWLYAEETFTDSPHLGQDYPKYDFEDPSGEKHGFVNKNIKNLNWEVAHIEPVGEPYVTNSKGVSIQMNRQPIIQEVQTEGVDKIEYCTPISAHVYDELPDVGDTFLPLFRFKVSESPTGARIYTPVDDAARDFVLEAFRVTQENKPLDPLLHKRSLESLRKRFFEKATEWIAANNVSRNCRAEYTLVIDIETNISEGDANDGSPNYARMIYYRNETDNERAAVYLPQNWGDWDYEEELKNKYCFVKTNFSSCILPLDLLNLMNTLKAHLGLPEDTGVSYSSDSLQEHIQRAKESIITDTGSVEVTTELFMPEFWLNNEVDVVNSSYGGRVVSVEDKDGGVTLYNFPEATYIDINRDSYELAFEWSEDAEERDERVLGVYIQPWAQFGNIIKSSPSQEEIDKHKNGEDIEVEKAEVEYFNSITFVEFDKSISG